MPDDTVSTRLSELDEARESAARLLEKLAEKVGVAPAVRSAAHYVQDHSLKDVLAGIDKAARRRPAYSIAVAVVAGFLVGRAISGGSRS